MKIIFYGTPEFAVPSLEILLKNGHQILAVVTAPDKPAGRGLKMISSDIKQFAEKHSLKILQPVKLKNPDFLKTIEELNPELQIVVAFRKMPEEAWNLPAKGTFNLHGSLLPQYRGAAPIQRAVMNGETETGVTTFFLEKEIDTGKIIFQERIPIGSTESTGELHDRMSLIGAALVLKTVNAIEKGNISSEAQQDSSELKTAPKIHKEDCRIDLSQNRKKIFDQIRGLSPYPGAFLKLTSETGETKILKIYKSSLQLNFTPDSTGNIYSDSKEHFAIKCADGWIALLEVQLEGKKKMSVQEFLRGTKILGYRV